VERSTSKSPSSFSQMRFHGSGLGAGTFDLLSVSLKFAAVAGTGNQVQFRLPRREAAEMRAHRAQREVAFLRMNDVDARVHIERDRIERIAVGLAGVDHGRRLVEHIRLEELIGERGRAGSGDVSDPKPSLQRTCGDLTALLELAGFFSSAIFVS
jgi:hypothetical protein